MNKIDKVLVYGIFAIAPVCIILFFIISIFRARPIKQVIMERDSLQSANGVIDTLFNNRKAHNVRTAIMTNKTVFEILPEWEGYFDVGDSVNKKKGSFILGIKKKNGKKIVLDYRTTLPSK